MTYELTSAQLDKILVAKNYFNNSNDPDSLYQVIVILGPSFLGSFFGSNSETVWSRVENPENFRYEEMMILSELFEISVVRFIDQLEKQIEHNRQEIEMGRPIGRKRYKNKHVQGRSVNIRSKSKKKRTKTH